MQVVGERIAEDAGVLRQAPRYGLAVATEETFSQDGPWIQSSLGFRVRSLGRAGMEYIRGSHRLELNAEALATNGFVLYPSAVPADEREQILADVTRAWRWAGLDVEPQGF